MAEHRIDLTAKPSICAEARRLLAEGLAEPDDAILGMRGDKVCLISTVGAAAKLTVSETQRTGQRFVRWTPFPGKRVFAETRETESGGTGVAGR